MKIKCGFTIIEFIIIAAFASLFFVLFFVQKANLEAMQRDEQRKVTINAMYYALEKSFYTTNSYYPEQINADVLTVVDPTLWTDPLGYDFNNPFSSYSYEPASCDTDGRCKEYTLKAVLEKETAYIKTNRN